ncbi:MAG: LysR substrate-binding domain-containing protein [Arthrobacter sp.]
MNQPPLPSADVPGQAQPAKEQAWTPANSNTSSQWWTTTASTGRGAPADRPASLSQTIASLEKELGVPLFHRIGRRAVLSDAGKELVGPARLVIRDLDAAQSAVQAPGVEVLELERQPLILIVNPRADAFPANGKAIQREDLGGHRIIASQRGSLMRWLVNDTLAQGVKVKIVVEVAHRTSILPLVLAGMGHAVMPSSWGPTAHRAGLRTLLIEPVQYLDVAILSRRENLTPAARAFLEVASRHTERTEL